MQRMRCETCSTRTVGSFCNLPADHLEDFRAAGVTAVYRPRQVVFHEGSVAQGLHLVCQGEVKLFHSDRLGREHILELAGPGTILGELCFDESLTQSVSAEAMVESQVSFVPRERLLPFLERHPGTALRLLDALSGELVAARRKARDLALKGAESRLASWLLQLAEATGRPSSGQRLHIPYSRREVAEMIGVSTETAIRLLGKLENRNAIELDRRSVVIKDVEKLTRLGRHEETESWVATSSLARANGSSG